MRIQNPYIVGNPIEDRNLFFGREDDFLFIRNKICGQDKGGLLVLCGSRRSGKTSILFQIKNGRLGPEFVPALIDMQAMVVDNDADFLAEIVHAISVGLGQPGAELESVFEQLLEERGGNGGRAFQDFLTYLSGLLSGRKVVLMFDEYELFETHIRKDRFSTDILHLLANWMEHREGVFIIFTGSDKLDERRPGFWEHFLGKARHRRISFLSRSDTLRLIEKPVEGVVDFDEDCLESIWSISAGQPFYTQVICQALIDTLNEKGKATVSNEDLEGVLSEIVDNPLPQMVFTWSALSKDEKLTLALVAETTTSDTDYVGSYELHEYADTEGIATEVPVLNEALETLFHKDMLSKFGEESRYRFRMDLWRRWIARQHSVWQVVNELGLPPKAKRNRNSRRNLLWGFPVLLLVALAAFGIYQIAKKPAPVRLDPVPEAIVLEPAGVREPEAMLASVTSEPEGAEIFIAGESVGQTPLINHAVDGDSLEVRLEKRGYAAATSRLVLEKSGLGHLHLVLQALPGSLSVDSDPSGAQVRLVGEKGTWVAPCLIEGLSPNRTYEAVLHLANYEKSTRVVRVAPDSLSTLRVGLQPVRYLVDVSADPPANLTIGSKSMGKTPLNLARTAGTWQMHFELDGYAPVDTAITLPGTEVLHVELARLGPGFLVLKIKPYGTVVIDGQEVAADRVYFGTALPSGRHRIELSHTVFGKHDMDIGISPHDTVLIEHDFRVGGGER